METGKNAARILGLLYIIGSVAGILSRVLTAPVLSAQDLLTTVAASGSRIPAAALMVLLMGAALALVPVVGFPILRRHDEVLALGYVVFRGALEGAGYMGIVVSWLLLLPLSRIDSLGIAYSAELQAVGQVLLNATEIGVVLMLGFSLGGLLFYALLYRSKLVPRWLSAWGLGAILLNLAAGLLAMFGVIDLLSGTSTVLQLPIFLQETVLAVWLIVRGFSPTEYTRK
jgi:hypothetical protein